MSSHAIVVVSVARTPMGGFQGVFRDKSAAELGAAAIVDHMFFDGLEDAYEKGRLMGTFAEDCASKYAFSREEQDARAIRSLERARRANEDGSFAFETTTVTATDRKGDRVIDHGEPRGRPE